MQDYKIIFETQREEVTKAQNKTQNTVPTEQINQVWTRVGK